MLKENRCAAVARSFSASGPLPAVLCLGAGAALLLEATGEGGWEVVKNRTIEGLFLSSSSKVLFRLELCFVDKLIIW